MSSLLLKFALWLGGEALRDGLARQLALEILAELKAHFPGLPIPGPDQPHPVLDAIDGRIRKRLGG